MKCTTQTEHTIYTHNTHTALSLIFKRKKMNPREAGTRLDQLCFCRCETKIRAFTSVLEMAQEIFPRKMPLNIEGSVNWH